MINLLPPAQKDSFRYARRNTHTMPWVVALVIALAGLGVIALYGVASSNNVAASYQKQIGLSQKTLQDEHVDTVRAKAADVSTSLNLALKVLGREVLFSKLLQQISTVVPNGVNLTGLNINQDDGALDIVANASNYQAATQLQANLTDPNNQLFSEADLVSVDCSKSATQTDPAHPCTVTISALFGANDSYLFISNKNGGKS